MTSKRFRLVAAEIKRLVPPIGSCIATDLITVGGQPVGFAYRQQPVDAVDSGWRFLSGTESQEYLDDPKNIELYDVNTIANYDRDIIPLLDAPVGSAFERDTDTGRFVAVHGFETPD